MSTVSVFIDDSDGYLGIIIGNEFVIGSLLIRPIKRLVGKTVHMKRLGRKLKLHVARLFTEISCELSESHDLTLLCGRRDKVLAWLDVLIENFVREKREVPTFYIDRGIEVLLRKQMHPFYFRFLTIYIDKDKTLCADILAWINLRRARNKFIWSKLATHIEEIGSASKEPT